MYKACIFILTHERAEEITTYRLLQQYPVEYPVYIVVDDQDKQLDLYKELFGERLLIFNKEQIIQEYNIDLAENFKNYLNITVPRTACFKLAKELGYDCFLELDDDYTRISYKVPLGTVLKDIKVPSADLNKILKYHFEFLMSTPVDSVALGQAGDYIGGVNASVVKHGSKRKAMNFLFMRTENVVKFSGTLNEDVTCYTNEAMKGKIFLTFPFVSVAQIESQQLEGGLEHIYKDYGTYVKSFYSILYTPSAIKIATMAGNNKDARGHTRIHHNVLYNNCTPKILSESYKKT